MSPSQSRGHEALQLLASMLVEFDKCPPLTHALFARFPTTKHVTHARRLVAAASAALYEPARPEPDYCALCDAIHPPLKLVDELAKPPEPEPHGRRRSI